MADGRQIESPKAFLSSVTTRLSIDQLRSARSRREAYIGPWLPEPGALFYDSSGLLVSVLCLDIVDGVVQAVRSVINPDKLQHLGPLSDFRSQPRHPRASGTGE